MKLLERPTPLSSHREPRATGLWRIDLDSGDEQLLARFPHPIDTGTLFDIAEQTDRLTLIVDRAVRPMDLRSPVARICKFHG